MNDDLQDRLDGWGRQPTPPADGAFVNRVEAQLRSEMLDGASGTRRPLLLRPGVIVAVMAVAAVLGAVALSSTRTGETAQDGGLADPVVTTTTPPPAELDEAPTTTAVGEATVAPTTAPTTTQVGDTSPPRTGTVPPPIDDESNETTTVPWTLDETPTTAPATTAPPQTDAPAPDDSPATTIPLPPTVEGQLVLDGRAVTVSWTVNGDDWAIEGWVLVRTIDGVSEIVEISRDERVRSFVVRATDLAETYRVEARDAGGEVVAATGELSLSRDG